MSTHHLYVHVPFCRLVCAYCDFVTVGGRRTEIPRYVEALLAELAMRPAPGELATIYSAAARHRCWRPARWHGWWRQPATGGDGRRTR